ncbi:DUF3500 domain-containing protein [Cellulomonas sp. IC4_254]|uniref:DUF3500 domain-containing protein n=1 Tax=Cellulomonas sp. IC4_254 TaxID=2714040 RepID=UPI0014241DE0|nr:DUF3500 domain-containing protein [Cellulomonas sp. IC4_254]NHT16102.1 DUF3500 domain-containing protein [Cellulomonas sp. IC4_254]
MPERDDHQIDAFFSAARVSGRDEDVVLTGESYREHLYDHDDPVLAQWRGLGYDDFSARKREPAFVQELLADWQALYDEPFVGVTDHGAVRDDVHRLPEGTAGDLPPDAALLAAAARALATLTDDERARVQYPLDAPQWRAWSNPEFVIHRVGLRLEDLAPESADAVLDVVRASLSPEGWARVAETMALNGFLGELVDLPALMNERSYWFSLFGSPSPDEPWGWQLFGHHVAVCFVTVAGRHVVAPVFLGAEPALADGARPALFDARERTALDLASSLTAAQRDRAVVYRSVLDPAMPPGRLHPADERHVAGAFRDNRVVPYEGIGGADLTDAQWATLLRVVEDFHALLVAPQRAMTLQEVDAHRSETWFAWYGATDGSQPFYLRVHSPVVLAELDHHAGVWLSNRLPARFHVHTTLRLPNGNDYGRAYVAQHRARRRPPG